jgi:hypothetical protein
MIMPTGNCPAILIWNRFDMEQELGAILGRKIDLVTRSAIKRSRNRFYRREILGTAKRFLPRVRRLIAPLIPPDDEGPAG